HLHPVADLVQIERRDEAGNPDPEDQDGSTLWVPLEPDRPVVGRFGREPQSGHRLIHRRAAADGADHGEKTPATNRRRALFGHDGSLPGAGFLGELPHNTNLTARLREQIRRLGYFALRPSSFSDIRRLSNAKPSPKTSAWHRARTRRYNDRRIRMALAD